MWRVRYAKSVGFKLKRKAFRDFEVPCHTQIEVEESWPAHNVAASVAKETVEQSWCTGRDLLKR